MLTTVSQLRPNTFALKVSFETIKLERNNFLVLNLVYQIT